MAIRKKTKLVLDHHFDSKNCRCRHTVNGRTNVLHCHHYATLYTQLAKDCAMLDGKPLLADVAEDTFCDVLSSYFAKHGITGVADRIPIAEQYYAASGLGKMQVVCAGPDSGRVDLLHSHLDEGWIKKWGRVMSRSTTFQPGAFPGSLLLSSTSRRGASVPWRPTASHRVPSGPGSRRSRSSDQAYNGQWV